MPPPTSRSSPTRPARPLYVGSTRAPIAPPLPLHHPEALRWTAHFLSAGNRCGRQREHRRLALVQGGLHTLRRLRTSTPSHPSPPRTTTVPTLSGSAEPGSTVRLYQNTACTGTPIRKAPAVQFASGITVHVDDNTSTSFRAAAVDAAGNISPCSPARTYVEDSISPQTTIKGGPSTPTTDSTPTFTFTSNEAQSTFRCRFDQRSYGPCSGPGQSHTPSTPLATGPHTFYVRASTGRRTRTGRPPSAPSRVIP